MKFSSDKWMRVAAMVVALVLLSSCGFKRKKYENPIANDTQQPDKVLFDKAVGDLERGRYEVARLTLQTLMNTYDTSEYLAKAKLAYADSWFREGGSHGLAQAEAEYKDFILFYPTLEESAEAQEKVCMIHYRQMEKADRDPQHALRAEEECRTVLVQFPNSKFAPRAQQLLRNVQEVIAEGEFRRGSFYHTRGSNPAAANRLQALANHYPLYSKADEANWLLGDAYAKMGTRFRPQAGAAYSRIVREYPLSPFAEDAKKRLTSMEMAIPEVDPVAYNRMKYELENREKAGLADQAFGVLKRGPDVRTAAKSGEPAMTPLRPTVPVSVPDPAAAEGAAGFAGDVTATTIQDSTTLDTQPDARGPRPAAGTATGAPATGETAAPAPGTTTNDVTGTVAPIGDPAAAGSRSARERQRQQQEGQQQKQQGQEEEMTRILLADDSPHAQRMGERILREEGFEVVTVTDGITALMRLADVDPDVVFADVSLPRKSGYDICRELKSHPRHKHVRVILTAGLLESFDEALAAAVNCDGVLKKPFEASLVMETLRPLVEAAGKEREEYGPELAMLSSDIVPVKVVTDYSELAPAPSLSQVDVERVRAAVTVALDAALPAMIDRVTEQVLVALGH